MGDAFRGVDDCRFRQPEAEPPGESAACGLLADITGVEDLVLCRVRRDACEACCRSFPPSPDRPNPVVASLLYQTCSRIAERNGVPGCDRPRAERLRRLAAEWLAIEEEDAPPAGAGEAPGPGFVARLIPVPRRRSGPRVRSWAVGVTTAPRRAPTLAECLPTLLAAGWDSPRLFVDGDVDVPDEFAHLPRTRRDPQIGAWPNYFLALGELLMREPAADAYLIAQDDVSFCADPLLREYLEQALWPGDGPGVASLYCSRAYTRPRPGWYRFSGRWRWGAQAFVFSREAARRFLADPEVVRHRWSRFRNGLADISFVVGRWALSAGVPVYHTTPSLVQHVGDVSAIWADARVTGNRRASWFAGRDPAPL